MSGALDEFTAGASGNGLDSNLSTNSGIGTSPTPSTPGSSNNFTSGVSPNSILDGELSSVVFNGKRTFDNTQSGFILGQDTDDLIKFYIGNTTNYFNWDGTNLTISGTITGSTFQTATTGQRIRILSAAGTSPTQAANSIGFIDASNNLIVSLGTSIYSSAIEVTRSVASGSAMFASISGNGRGITLDMTGGTGIVAALISEHTATGIPLDILKVDATSTHFRPYIILDSSTIGDGNTIWKSDGVTPNGSLSGTAGDVCINGDSSQIYYCTGGTAWTAPGGVGFSAVFGDGSDASVTYDGSATILSMAPVANVYTLTRDIFCTSITINVGVTVKTANYKIYCTGIFTINGTLDNSGNAGGNAGNGTTTTGNNQQGAGGTAGTAGAGVAAGSLPAIFAGGVGSTGQTGGSGAGATSAGNGTNATNSFATTAKNAGASGAGGTGGGVGIPPQGGGAAGTAGVVSSTSVSNVHALITFLNLFDAGGQIGDMPSSGGGGWGGGGETNQPANQTSAGGGGGGGGAASPGGMLMVFAKTIIVGATGVITANGAIGGNGGNGGSASGGSTANPAGGGGGGGAGSNGGIIGLVYHSYINSGTVSANGGTGGGAGTQGTGFGSPANGIGGATGQNGFIYQFQV